MNLLNRVERLEQEVGSKACETCARLPIVVILPGMKVGEQPTSCPDCGVVYETFTISPRPSDE